jgi:hypothetical protein
MKPLVSSDRALTVRDTERAWKAESPVIAPGVLVTVAPAGWPWVSGAVSVIVVPDTESMLSVSVGEPTVMVSPAANVSGF